MDFKSYRILSREEVEAFERAARDFPDDLRIESAGILRSGESYTVYTFDPATVPCPYCNRPVKRTVQPDDIHLCGEHCDYCFLPFGIDENGNPYGQDDPRWI